MWCGVVVPQKGAPPKKGPPKKGQKPKILVDVFVGRKKGGGGGGGSCVGVVGDGKVRERERCVRYGGQRTTDDDAVCVPSVYGRDSGGG